MQIALLVILAIIAFAATGISGSLRGIYQHNRLFTPEAPEGATFEPGSLVHIRAFGLEQVCVVVDFMDGAVLVEPVGTAGSVEPHEPDASEPS